MAAESPARGLRRPPPHHPPLISLDSASVSSNTVCIDGTARSGTSGVSITRLSWKWGDGASGIHEFPSCHDYKQPGTYTAIVTASQSDGLSASASESVRVPAGKLG